MLQGHFVPSAKGKLFVTQFGRLTSKTAILCLPSITEEMNLSRAVIAKQAQAFTHHEVPCFVMDYFGTGDSEGEFEQASPNVWLENILTVGRWLLEQGIESIMLWGVRFGGLLQLTYQDELHDNLPISQQLLWKPVLNGKQFFGQFFRIKQASEMMNLAVGAKKTNWRQAVIDDKLVEVAGYITTKQMLQESELLSVAHNTSFKSPVVWLELASKTISPAVKKIIGEDSDIAMPYECAPFWQVPEIFELPNLNEYNISLLGLNSNA